MAPNDNKNSQEGRVGSPWTIAERLSGHNNNFNLIRFLAATAVLLDHAAALAGTGNPRLLVLGPLTLDLTVVPLGHIGVDVFFVVSGFLVTRSVLTRPTVLEFAVSRVLRLFPALLIVVLASAFLLGPLITSQSLSAYFGDLRTWIYAPVTGSLITHTATLPGVFDTVPAKGIVNSPLWTLRYEAVCYAILAGLALFGALFRHRIVYSLAGLLAAYLLVTFATDLRGDVAAIDSLSRFALTFFLGGALYVFSDKIPLHWAIMLGLSLLALATALTGIGELTFRVALAYAVVWFALVPAGPVRNFNRLGDYSYGLYILCWPIQQTVVTLDPTIAAPALFAISFPVALGIAALSWHLVEHPALKQKERAGRMAGTLLEKLKKRFGGGAGRLQSGSALPPHTDPQ